MHTEFLAGVVFAWVVAYIGIGLSFCIAYIIHRREPEHLLFGLHSLSLAIFSIGLTLAYTQASSSDARFAIAEVKWSLFPMGGSTARLPRQIAFCNAMEILLMGEQFSAADALRTAGRYDDAIAAYQSIQSKNTRLTTVSLMLATLYREKAAQEKDAAAKQALLTRAITAYTDLLKADDTNARARVELGVTQMTAGNMDAAAKSFQDVITANPKTTAAAEAAAHLQEIRK